MGEKRNPARKPERRSHIRRLKCTPENNIETNLKGIGNEIKDGIRRGQDSVRVNRSFEDSNILSNTIKGMNFLNPCVTISFP
jgi:hypothetical protein